MTRIDPKPPRRRLAVTDIARLVGRTGRVTFAGMTFRVKIRAAKIAYGHVRCHVTPIAGRGSAWIGNIELE